MYFFIGQFKIDVLFVKKRRGAYHANYSLCGDVYNISNLYGIRNGLELISSTLEACSREDDCSTL